MLRLDRHPLGPRVYVLGTRVHEWHLGAALLLALLAGGADRPARPLARDRTRDVRRASGSWRRTGATCSPSQRDTTEWRLGLHGRSAPLRGPRRRADPLPRLAALGALLARPRQPRLCGHAEHRLAESPAAAGRAAAGAPALARSRGAGLAAPARDRAVPLAAPARRAAARARAARRARRARPAQGARRRGGGRKPRARGDPLARPRRVLRPARPGHARARRCGWSRSSALGGLLLCGLAVWIAAPENASFASIARETFAALLWQPGPLDFHDELGGVDEAVGAFGLLALAGCFGLLLRPLAAPRALPDVDVRRAVRRLVSRHGDGHARLLQAPPRPALPLQPRRPRLRRLPRRGGRAARLRRPGRRRRRAAGALPQARRVRRGARPEARRGRRRRDAAAALAPARPALALPRRRGRRRHRGASRSRAARSGRCASRSRAWRRPATRPSWSRSAG